MALICEGCASRLQRAVSAIPIRSSRRTFSHTSNIQRSLPTFAESSNAELNDALQTLRSYYFVPAYLPARQQKLIYSSKYKQYLTDNPRTAFVGDEEVPLQHIDQFRNMPSRHDLVKKALDIIFEQTGSDWKIIPELLRGLNEGVKRPAQSRLLQKIIFKAQEADKMGIVIECLQQASKTGMNLRDTTILRSVLSGLRTNVQAAQWSEAALKKALSRAKVLAELLEVDEHGADLKSTADGQRAQLEVLAHFLELAAAEVHRFHGDQDTQGVVKVYAERLLSLLNQSAVKPSDVSLASTGPQWELLSAISIWHALHLSQLVLRKQMPQAALAFQLTSGYKSTIEALVQDLTSQNPEPGSRNDAALKAWAESLHDG